MANQAAKGAVNLVNGGESRKREIGVRDMFTHTETETSSTRFFYWAVIIATVGMFGFSALSLSSHAAVPASTPAKTVQTTAVDPSIETVTVVAKRLAS